MHFLYINRKVRARLADILSMLNSIYEATAFQLTRRSPANTENLVELDCMHKKCWPEAWDVKMNFPYLPKRFNKTTCIWHNVSEGLLQVVTVKSLLYNSHLFMKSWMLQTAWLGSLTVTVKPRCGILAFLFSSQYSSRKTPEGRNVIL